MSEEQSAEHAESAVAGARPGVGADADEQVGGEAQDEASAAAARDEDAVDQDAVDEDAAGDPVGDRPRAARPGRRKPRNLGPVLPDRASEDDPRRWGDRDDDDDRIWREVPPHHG